MIDSEGGCPSRSRHQAGGNFLPATDSLTPASQVGGQECRQESGQLSVAECKVLVVDDNPAVLRLMAEMFSLVGYPVTEALGLEEAISFFSESHYHLLFTDFDMPLLNGYHLGRRVKINNPFTRVVIMAGGYCDEADWLPTRSQIDGWLLKPVAISEISRLISALGLPNGFYRWEESSKSNPVAASRCERGRGPSGGSGKQDREQPASPDREEGI